MSSSAAHPTIRPGIWPTVRAAFATFGAEELSEELIWVPQLLIQWSGQAHGHMDTHDFATFGAE